MTQIDRNIINLIAKDMESALQDVAKKYDVEIKYKGGSFTQNNATLKIDISTISQLPRPQEAWLVTEISFVTMG